jgi:excisionase family DNA binding protein
MTNIRSGAPRKPICAICWVDPETGRAGTNSTTWICRKCKKDPENVDWVDEPAERIPSIDTAIREAVREVVREEIRLAVREELARIRLDAEAGSRADTYLSVGEAAKVMGVHPGTVRAWIRDGQLPQHRAGRHYRVRKSELEAFARSLPPKEAEEIEKRAAKLAAA